MKWYNKEDFTGEYSVSEGVPFKDLVDDVLDDYKDYVRPETSMAAEIAELRIWIYQGGVPWPFKIKQPTEGMWEDG